MLASHSPVVSSQLLINPHSSSSSHSSHAKQSKKRNKRIRQAGKGGRKSQEDGDDEVILTDNIQVYDEILFGVLS